MNDIYRVSIYVSCTVNGCWRKVWMEFDAMYAPDEPTAASKATRLLRPDETVERVLVEKIA